MHRPGAAVGRCASRRLSFAIVACAMLVAPLRLVVAKAPDEVSLAAVLALAGRYVHQFEQDFFLVIAEEDGVQTYQPGGVQRGRATSGGRYDRPLDFNLGSPVDQPTRRQIHSELLVLRQGNTWLAVRNVLWLRDSADQPRVIADSKGRLDRLLRDASPGQASSSLRALADESARFNLGHLYRNFNLPTLALQFLGPEFQARFAFTLAARETISGVPAVKIEFAERQPPTVISLNDKQDTLSSGFVWMRESDGAVLRTRLTIKAPQTRDGPGIEASVSVDYRRDGKLNMWVPRRMEEEYVEVMTAGERVDCLSTYSNYRRFETSGRLVTPK
jgi:hypothetical protein